MGTVVALGGQVGGAKLADGLYRLRGKDLAVVVNTGDDYEHLGLAFSPDIDTALYALAGLASAESGWEPAAETRALHGMLKALGGAEQPMLGDKSLAAPLLRTQGLAAGRRLTEVTARLLPQPRHRGARAADERRPGAHSCADRRRRDSVSGILRPAARASRACAAWNTPAPTRQGFRTRCSTPCMRPISRRWSSARRIPTTSCDRSWRSAECASCCASAARR